MLSFDSMRPRVAVAAAAAEFAEAVVVARAVQQHRSARRAVENSCAVVRTTAATMD